MRIVVDQFSMPVNYADTHIRKLRRNHYLPDRNSVGKLLEYPVVDYLELGVKFRHLECLLPHILIGCEAGHKYDGIHYKPCEKLAVESKSIR